MPRKNAHKPTRASGLPVGDPDFTVLLVEPEARLRRTLTDRLRGPGVTIITAASLADARREATRGIDLALVARQLPDGDGMELADQLNRGKTRGQAILLSDKPSATDAIAAVRAGFSDILTLPLDFSELDARVRQAIDRQRLQRLSQQRIERLRRICKKLNQAREDVAKQVDVICNDLVNAYQELATQMNQAMQTSEFTVLVKNDLDLESMLRKTLEFILQKAGPTNAAIFLPTTGDEYSLGGYVNYDCTSESADVLLQHLADVVAPKLADHEGAGVVHVTDNETLSKWIGDDAAYLADSHVVAFACRHKGETLAAVTVFRDHANPFSPVVLETCAAIGPILGEYLHKLIRIHHRHIPDADDSSETDFGTGGLAA
ncbi:MAG: response regulator [Planctomycetes bacterium]|nr:response regulator [Planctomycetota bacterium]